MASGARSSRTAATAGTDRCTGRGACARRTRAAGERSSSWARDEGHVVKRGKGLWATVKAVVERILDLDQFWWLWATTVVGVTVGLRVFGGGPFAPAAGFAAIPLFLGGIGLTSIVYALVIELLLHREVVEPTDDDCTPPRVRSMRPRGEAMIP